MTRTANAKKALVTVMVALSVAPLIGACTPKWPGEEISGQDTDSVTAETTGKETDTEDDMAVSGKGTQQLEAYGIRTYVTKVGYKDGFGYDPVIISSKSDWDGFVATMANTLYDSDGNEISEPNPNLRDYDEEFFSHGNKLIIQYSDLGSSGYEPTITGMLTDGDTVDVTCEVLRPEGMFFTTDMSGFVIVAEVPADSGIASMKVLMD
jgi:hypothetical protein